ncbi:Ribosomal large subunit pseudouridine synthase C [Buchnera aphidicola (Pterocallis alni)]|uniref:RluA family pseudouridine synthase n=1 Tax=Buchnera aphidicola TaxID=9 RepID=UPI003463BA62
MKQENTKIINIIIKNNNIDQRIDNFILSKFQITSKNQLYKKIRIGNIKINEKKILPHYRLALGDNISIQNIQLKKKQSLYINKRIKEKLLSCILYEDKHLIIINKPSGIPVHGGSGIAYGIIELFRIIKNSCTYLELIHRLDKDTSGILMMCKNKTSLKKIQQQFKEKKVKKKYIALLHGKMIPNKQIISQPLIKNQLPNEKKKVIIHTHGKPSTTIFKEKYFFKHTTLAIIIPKTGRTHQIRVHAAYIGNPILFDKLYGNTNLDDKIHTKHKKKKILLHAQSIIFYHPINNKQYFIKAPIKNRFKKYMK